VGGCRWRSCLASASYIVRIAQRTQRHGGSRPRIAHLRQRPIEAVRACQFVSVQEYGVRHGPPPHGLARRDPAARGTIRVRSQGPPRRGECNKILHKRST
jgi:hypothetical protein